MGLWSVSRSALTGYQTVGGTYTGQVWMLYTNENTTKTYTFNCKDKNWISTPFVSGTKLQNLFSPYETYDLQDSLSSFNNDSKAPWFGCLPSITMDPFSFKALVPAAQWLAPLPVITKFVPGHDARLLAKSGDANATTVDISFQFNTAMSCTGVTQSISFNMSSSGHGSAPSITNVQCAAIQSPDPTRLSGAPPSTWSWSATLTNFPDGVLTITVNNPASTAGNSTGVCFSSVQHVLDMP
jgi:alpha-1,3-glucan synthase